MRKCLISATMLLTATACFGQVAYSGPMNQLISRNAYLVDNAYVYPEPKALNLDLTGDGVDDFSIFTYSPVPGLVLYQARALNGSYYLGRTSSVLDSLAAGVSLGSGPQWSSDLNWPSFPLSQGQNWWVGGHWEGSLSAAPSDPFFLGLKIHEDDGYHFGWLALTLNDDPAGYTYSLRGWAVEQTAGRAILTGDVGAPLVPVPEPSTYGFLAALGLSALAWIRRAMRR